MVDLPPHRKRRQRPNNTGSADRGATCYAGQFHIPDTAGVGYCVRCGAPSGENTDPGAHAADTALDDQFAPLRYDDDPDAWWAD